VAKEILCYYGKRVLRKRQDSGAEIEITNAKKSIKSENTGYGEPMGIRASGKGRKRTMKKVGKGFIAEFRKFITRGNVLDMAVGVIVGGAFTSIVTSLNTDILTPLLGIFGGTDFSYLTVTLGSGENAPVLNYGNFITAVINFLITALVIFCLVKGINAIGERVKKKESQVPAAPTTKKCPYCLSEIPLEATRCPHCTSRLDQED
jgi:large conductance mechanosensitive channel